MDIRSFFGSTKKAPLAPASAPAVVVASPVKESAPPAKAATPKKSPAKVKAEASSSSKKKRKGDSDDEDDDFVMDLDDSDEDEPKAKQARKRLKSAAEAKTASPAPAVKEELDSANKKRTSSSAAANLSPEPSKKQKVIAAVEAKDEETPVKPAPSKSPAKVKKQPEPAPSNKASEGLYFDELKIAVSGTFQSMSREEVEEYIKERGGKISSAVSGKTNYLVVGHILEDGREVTEGSKYRTAKEKNVPILTESEFFAKYPNVPMVRTSSVPPVVPMNPATSAAKAALNQMGKSTTTSTSTSKAYVTPGKYDLWVDKYRPSNPQDLVGHGDLVRRLSEWLRTWEGVHITKKLPKPGFSKENPGAKAVLISGPPGIGKTTVATIIARQFNFEVLELNASDTRNKRELDEKLVEAVSSHAISSAFGGSSSGTSAAAAGGGGDLKLQRRLVIMDEVDGMGGSDRGGMAELIKIIKISRVPIICICNDRQSPKIKSLANHCFDLRVRRPMKAQIADRLVAIAAQEGLTVDKNAAEILVEQAGNDIRAALNALQMWAQASMSTSGAATDHNHLGYTELKAGLSRIEKDKVLRLSPFDAALGLMAGDKAPWDERYNAFFVDYSLIPLLVQENYVDAAKNGVYRNPHIDDAAKMEALARAADASSDMDLVGTSIRGADQHWELLPTQAIFCMRVGHEITGFQAFPSFPSWLGKYSATNKKARLTRELVQHSSLSIGQGFVPMRLDYVPYLRNRLLQPLLSNNKDGCEETIRLLDEYGLSKEDFMESMREMQFILEKPSNPAEATLKDKFERLDTQTKSTLTRQYNAGSHTSMTIVQPIGLKGAKGKKKAASSTDGDGDEEGWGDDDDAGAEDNAAEEEEEEDVEALRAQLSKAASKGAKASAKSSARAAAGGGGGRGKAAAAGGTTAAAKKKK